MFLTLPSMSFPVRAATTRGSFRAGETSTFSILACAWGLRTNDREEHVGKAEVVEITPRACDELRVLRPLQRLADEPLAFLNGDLRGCHRGDARRASTLRNFR